MKDYSVWKTTRNLSLTRMLTEKSTIFITREWTILLEYTVLNSLKLCVSCTAAPTMSSYIQFSGLTSGLIILEANLPRPSLSPMITSTSWRELNRKKSKCSMKWAKATSNIWVGHLPNSALQPLQRLWACLGSRLRGANKPSITSSSCLRISRSTSTTKSA